MNRNVWNIPRIGDTYLCIPLDANDRLFIVGPNGSGKSALIQRFVSEYPGTGVRRISAHRQTWLESGSLTLTPQSRRQFEQNNMGLERADASRWIDYNSDSRQAAVLFDLVAKENTRARSIAHLVDNQNPEEATRLASQSTSLFDQLNELLALGRLPITLQNFKDEEIHAKHRDSSASYSIAQMSDGERNAAIIAATVLTVEPGTVLLIDEPERHLHRSIIEPFLSALFAHREDCTFIISTHEIALPTANPDARVLMVRSCVWEDDRAKAWDVDLLEPEADLPEDLRLAILGARRKILFVEGTHNSLDLPLYHALFHDISVVAKGSSVDVQKAVKGLRDSCIHHHINAYGLIDQDGRSLENMNKLAEQGIFMLDAYSVESLYYCIESIAAVASRQAESLDRDSDEMKEAAIQAAMNALNEDGLAERMAAKRCERLVRDRMVSRLPTWKDIKANTSLQINLSVKSPFPCELALFRKFIAENKFDQLVARYPLRESGVFRAVSCALEFRTPRLYQETLIARVRADASLARRLRQRIEPLATALSTQSTTQVDIGT